MPQKRNSPPPEVMTWPKASPVLVVALIFDAVRCMFEWFWFFGPALAGVVCTITVNGVLKTWTAGWLGAKTAAAVCGAGATVVGYVSSPALIAFGTVMAIAVGLLGWMTVGLWLMMTNSRIFKENAGHALWFIVSLAISEVPIIDGLVPALIGILWKMYSTQIKKDKVALKQYEEQQSAEQLQERKQQATRLMQIQAFRSNQIEEQGDIDAEEYNKKIDEMVDDNEIPDGVREAA